MGLYDDPEVAAAPELTATAPAAPKPAAKAANWWEQAPLAEPLPASGAIQAIKAGFQGSATGMALRGQMADLITDPQHSAWWERALTGITQVATDLPLMMVGGAAGTAAGAAIGGPAAPVTGILGGGAGMFAAPAALRETLVQMYTKGEIKTAEDFWGRLQEVAIHTAKEGAIGAATMGAGALAKTGAAALLGGGAASTAIGTGRATLLTQGAQRAAGTADVAAQIATMTTIPAALQGRLPDAQEFMDAAIVIGGLKGAHMALDRVMNTYAKTGQTPAEQVAAVKANPELAADFVGPRRPDVNGGDMRPPAEDMFGKVYNPTGTTSGVPLKLDRLIAEAQQLGRGGVPEAPDLKGIIKEIKAAGPLQTDMVSGIDRLEGLISKARDIGPLTDAERAEANQIATTIATEAPKHPLTEQVRNEATNMAETRLTELMMKEETTPLTDAERAERVFLRNNQANPDKLAAFYKLATPEAPITRQSIHESSQRVHDDVLQQLKAVDEARQAAGLDPLGDEHNTAVAALVRARVAARAARTGRSPEELYAERPLQIRDEAQRDAEVVKPPEGAPTFIPPEVDMFGDPIPTEVTPRLAVADLATREVPLKDLVLSKEVPQFKNLADEQGVIVPLGGKFDRTGVGPIQVWERTNGTMEVISGRHRLDLARRSGEETIPAQIHREADGFTAQQAATLDAQLNIREEQGSVADYAQYFKDSGITKEAANELGLLARAKGRTGFAIARDASPDLGAAHRAGLLSDEAALTISAAAPGSERLQALGMAMVQEGKSALIAVNTMKAVELMAADRMAEGKQGDIFGFDDSAMREASAMAKKATSIQRKISEQISAVSGASRRPELARKMGVDVSDPEGIQKKIVALKQEQYLWDNWPIHPELVAQLREKLGQEPSPEQKLTAARTKYALKPEGENLIGHDVDLGHVYTHQNRQGFRPGEDVKQFLLKDKQGEVQGVVNVDFMDGKVAGILTITTEGKTTVFDRSGTPMHNEFAGRQGWGEKAVRALAASSDLPLDIKETVTKAVGFWDTMGAKWATNERNHQDATLTFDDYAARRAHKLEDQQGATGRDATDGREGSRDGTPGQEQGRNSLGDAADRSLDFTAGVDHAAETPAEAALRDAEAVAQAQRKLFQAARKDQTETTEFKNWFGDSKVVGSDKQPLKVYHHGDFTPSENGVPEMGKDGFHFGTKNAAEMRVTGAIADNFIKDLNFEQDENGRWHWSSSGWDSYDTAEEGYKTEKQAFDAAASMSDDYVESVKEGADSNITAAYLSIKNPKRVTDQKDDWAPAIAKAKKEGYDGLVYKNKFEDMGSDSYIAFEPSQIKSATDNRGTFDANDPNILHQSDPWYSRLQNAVDALKMGKAPVQGWKDAIKGMLANAKISKDEVEALQLNEWLDAQEGKVTKEQVAAYIKGNGLKVVDVVLGGDNTPSLGDAKIAEDMSTLNKAGWTVEGDPEPGSRYIAFRDPEGNIEDAADLMNYSRNSEPDLRQIAEAADRIVHHMNAGDAADPTHFSQWQLPGGQNYREAFITMPEVPSASFQKAIPRTADAMREAGYKATIDEDNGFQMNYTVWAPDGSWITKRSGAPSTKGQPMEQRLGAILEHYDAETVKRNNELDVQARSRTWQDGHGPYDDIKNPIMRYRFNERTDADGKRVMFLEEVQPPVKSEFAKMPKYLQDNWLEMGLKRVVNYAALNGFDKVAWTTGAQQVERYTGALRNAVDAIEWKKTPEGVQIVGYKGGEKPEYRYRIVDSNGVYGHPGAYRSELEARQEYDAVTGRTLEADGYTIKKTLAKGVPPRKVVDTTEKEDALSDSIGKAMAERIINDPAQSGTIEGEHITIDKVWPAKLYDRQVPRTLEKIIGKMGGGKTGETSIETKQEATTFQTPEFRAFNRMESQNYEGVEDFKNGDGPVISPNVRVIIDGKPEEVEVTVDGSGVHMIFHDEGGFEPTDFFIASNMFPGPWDSRQSAQLAVDIAWKNPNSRIWTDAIAISGGAETLEPAPSTSSKSNQQSIDITPAVRDKASAGMPLFQKNQDNNRGSYDIAENLITTLNGADKSTVVHELWHSWIEEMKSDAERPDAPAQLKADWELMRKEYGIPASGPIPRAAHELGARTGERYLMEGKAPSAELAAIFERFKNWLLEIYKSVMNLDAVEINPELRGVLDRMLTVQENEAAAHELNVPKAYVEEAKANVAAQIVPDPATRAKPQPAPPDPEEARRVIEPGFKAEQISIQPLATELPEGPGKAPDNIHVNYAYINTPLDVKLAMQRMAEIDQANIQKQRGGTDGVKSWAESNAEQAKYLNDVLNGDADTLKILQPRDPNAQGPDVRLGILKKLAVGAAEDSALKRDIVLKAGHDATVRQQLEYMGSIERARMIQAEFLGERASVARALNALKDTTQGSGEIGRMLEAIGLGDPNKMHQAPRTEAEEQAYMKAKLDEILQNYRGKTVLDIAKLHAQIGTLKGTFKFAEEVQKATKWEMVVEGWKAGLLSGPVTHTTNLFGTGAFHAMRPAVDALASIIGIARGASPGMGETDRASMSESIARVTGMLGGIKDGLKVAGHAFLADELTGKTESYRNAIPGQAGHIIRTPLRAMAAEDALVSTMYERGELRGLAMRQAFDEQMNPGTREFAERVDYLTDHPTDQMKVKAEEAATRMTFNAPLGEKGVALQLFVNKWNLQWMIPFIRTPINVAKEMARMSPFAPIVGEWRAAIAKGGVERDRALAEMALGTGIMALTVSYALSGSISGNGSPDQGKNRAKVGVWQPYSILIGDKWYEYGRIQPTGTLMGLAADMAAVWDHMTDEEKDKIPKMLAIAFSNAVTNQTFLQGITNVVNAMSEPQRFFPRFAQQMAGSVVPNVVGQPTAMTDPVVREVNSALEAIQARIPGMRQELLPKRDWLGEPVQTKERMAGVMPVREQQVSEDKVRLEAARLNISVAGAPKKTHVGKGTGKLGDVELTPEERDKFEKIGGQMAHELLTNIVNAPGYDQIPDMIKKNIFARVMTASHKIAALQALPMDKRMSYLQSISEKVQQALEPGATQ